MNIAGKFARYEVGESDSDASSQALLQVRDFLSRQWRLIAVVTGIAIVIGIAYIAVTPKKYTAQADMIIDTKRTTWAQSELQAENRFVEDASVESEIETTRSESVASAVARQLHLTEDPEFIGSGMGLRSLLLSFVGIGAGPEREPTNEELMRRVLGTLSANLRVTRVGRSYIEQIAYTSLNREKAATIANAFAEAYIGDRDSGQI